MSEVKRGNYTFSSERSAQFYDIVTGRNGVPESELENLKLVWYSAHKFGDYAYNDSVCTCTDGCFFGDRAREAAEFVDNEIQAFKARAPVYMRSHHVAEFKSNIFPEVEKMFGVKYVAENMLGV